MQNNQNNGNFWFGFFIGGVVGAAVIALVGTKEGKKIAAQLLEKGEALEEDLEQKIKILETKGEELLSQAEEVRLKAMEKVEENKEIISEHLLNRMDEALTKIEDVQKQGVNITQDVHHRYFKKDGKVLSS